MTSEPLPTEAEVRGMPGEALTRLAWQCGLAPATVSASKNPPYFWQKTHERPDGHDSCLEAWVPDSNIDQADDVLRHMRDRGYLTSVYAGHDCGRVRVTGGVAHQYAAPQDSGIEILWGCGEPGNPAVPTEAYALLLVSVLAELRRRQGGTHA